MSTPGATASRVSRQCFTSAALSIRSSLVKINTGVAPLSKARTNSRSSRRWFGGDTKACNKKTTSILAAIVCASARCPSKLARRINALWRGKTISTFSPSAETTTQSPTATSAPMLRTRTGSMPIEGGPYQTVLQPRSRRDTRPGKLVPSRACDWFLATSERVDSHVTSHVTFQPSAIRGSFT